MNTHFDESKIRRAGDGKFAVKGYREADGGPDADLGASGDFYPRADASIEAVGDALGIKAENLGGSVTAVTMQHGDYVLSVGTPDESEPEEVGRYAIERGDGRMFDSDLSVDDDPDKVASWVRSTIWDNSSDESREEMDERLVPRRDAPNTMSQHEEFLQDKAAGVLDEGDENCCPRCGELIDDAVITCPACGRGIGGDRVSGWDRYDDELAETYDGSPAPAEPDDGRLDEAAITRRAQEASEQARRTGTLVPIRLGTDDPEHWDYDPEGADYEPDVQGTETMCGDYSIGAEPSIQYTWATGDPEKPYVSTRTYGYVEAYYTDADGERRQLEAGDDHQDALDEVDRRMQDWEDEHERLQREYDTVGGQAAYKARNAHLEKSPKVDYFVKTMTETITHHDPNDVGGSLIDSGYEHQDVETSDLIRAYDAETAARLHVQSIKREHLNPMARTR